MKITDLYTDDRAVSPVVGVALLIAIAVILAAVIGAVVLGLGTGGVDTPQAQMQAQFTDLDDGNDGEPAVVIDHNGGEPLVAEEVTFLNESDSVDAYTAVDDGNNPFEDAEDEDEFTGEDEFTAGETLYIDVEEDDSELTIVWEDPNSDSETVLEEFSD